MGFAFVYTFPFVTLLILFITLVIHWQALFILVTLSSFVYTSHFVILFIPVIYSFAYRVHQRPRGGERLAGRYNAEERASWLYTSPLSALSLALLSLLYCRFRFFLGGRDTVFCCSLLLSVILFLGTGWQSLEREERAELYQVELAIFSRGARTRASLDWVTGLFLGTMLLFLGTLLLFLGTLSAVSETRGGTRGGWRGCGSWIHRRQLSCNGEVTTLFKILGVMFDSKFTSERHIRSISSSVAEKIGLLRKSFRVFGDHDVLLKCFNSFILPCLEYLFPCLVLCSWFPS